MTFMQKMENKECNDAIKRIFTYINMDEIKSFIDGIECMSKARKKFYKNIINCRYEIIKEVYEKISK